jgi:secreted Zn-dependent insulinase-like peptidase
MTDQAFSTIVNSVMIDISSKDKNMNEEHDKWWSEISFHTYEFDKQNKKIENLKLITKSEFQTFFADFFGSETQRRIDMCYNSDSHKNQPSKETGIDSI